MKIFGVLKTSLQTMGIDEHHCHKQNRLLSLAKNVFIVSLLSLASIFLTVNIFVESDLKAAFACFFVSLTCLLNIATYLYILSQKSELLNTIDELEKSMQESKILDNDG